jgi:uncharacterized protein (TIGR02677 family)
MFDASNAGQVAIDSPVIAVFADIGQVLQELKELSEQSEPDAGKIHRNLLVLRARFEDLTATAQTLLDRLGGSTSLPVPDMRRLVDYGERFVAALVLSADNIRSTARDIEEAGLGRLLQAVSERSVRDGVDSTVENIAAACNQWHAQWQLFRDWFISQPGRPSEAEMLRERARATIPVLLRIITSINDRQIHRLDRSNDFRVLARWFAEAESDDDAHRLWRAVFGLCPARHLTINAATLDDYEAGSLSEDTSWLDAPPSQISIRPGHCGSSSQAVLSRIIDRSTEKERFAAALREDAERMLNAQSRFGTGRRMRLSELECLEAGDFELFLDLLAEALSARVFPPEAVEILSADGCLKIKLEPTLDGRDARVVTADGTFSGPDHWISVERASMEEAMM